jgi:cytochrome c-type biogenesis protein CcmH/NrfG
MPLILLGWLILIVSAIAISALLIFPPRSRGSRREQLDVETCKACLEDIGSQIKLGKLNEAEADAARLALLSQPRSSNGGYGQDLRRAARKFIAPVAVLLLVAGIGAVTSFVWDAPEATGLEDTISDSQSPSGSDGEMLAGLTDYTRSIATEEPASTAAAGKLLPDVNTMIERLAARLETAPGDIEGWRTLGWSYFHTARYEQAAAAFANAVELDPSSAELTRSYEEAKAKASESDSTKTAASLQTGAVGNGGDGPGAEKETQSEAMPTPERDAVIRSMVDGLADRLESSPRDVEGWTRLMRSRVVLGEREVAATAFRKALDVFKDDSAASDKITAAAIELGLRAE